MYCWKLADVDADDTLSWKSDQRSFILTVGFLEIWAAVKATTQNVGAQEFMIHLAKSLL